MLTCLLEMGRGRGSGALFDSDGTHINDTLVYAEGSGQRGADDWHLVEDGGLVDEDVDQLQMGCDKLETGVGSAGAPASAIRPGREW